MVKIYFSYAFLLAIVFEEIRANDYTPDLPNYINVNQNDLNKGKRGVASIVETVQSQHVGANVVPIPVPVHVPVPRPYPVGIPKPVGVPVGVPVAVRVAVPRPYPVPVLVDAAAAAAGLEYGLGLYGGHSSLEYHTLLNYLPKANNHMGHLTAHDQHSLMQSLALAKLIH